MATVTTNNGVRYVPRRRRPDVFDRVFGAVLVTAFVAGFLVAAAIGAGALWLIVVVVQDIARRLG